MRGLRSTDPYDFTQFFLASGPAVANWAAEAPINTDDNLWIESRTPLLISRLDRPEMGRLNLVNLAPLLQPATTVLTGLTPEESRRIRQVYEGRRLFFKALFHKLAGEEAAADAAIDASYRSNPANYLVRSILEHRSVERGQAAILRRDWAGAILALHRARRYIPESRSALYLLAQTAIERARVAEGCDLLMELLRLYPRYFEARLILGEKLLEQGQPRRAADQFLYVAEQVPASRRARYNLADSLLRMGMRAQAIGVYESLVRSEPADLEARQRLLSAQTKDKIIP
jgi:tetratricopeptide (TPR) repeat protein